MSAEQVKIWAKLFVVRQTQVLVTKEYDDDENKHCICFKTQLGNLPPNNILTVMLTFPTAQERDGFFDRLTEDKVAPLAEDFKLLSEKGFNRFLENN